MFRMMFRSTDLFNGDVITMLNERLSRIQSATRVATFNQASIETEDSEGNGVAFIIGQVCAIFCFRDCHRP
jgi:hypothetical protein